MPEQASTTPDLSELYRIHQPQLYRWALSKTRNQHLAEDVTSETWTKVAAHLGNYRPLKGAGFNSWLYMIAGNVLRDRARACDRRPETLHDDFSNLDYETPDGCPVDSYERSASAEIVLGELAVLTPTQAEALDLRFVSGLSVAEVAIATGKSAGAVRKAQHDGIAVLRRGRGLVAAAVSGVASWAAWVALHTPHIEAVPI